MKKFKEFLFAFCWIITCEIILTDLGWSSQKTQWGKYLDAAVWGLAWTFYFQKQFQKERKQAKEKSN
ncbi:MAG TPA: hypothetical protein VMH01_00705 [Puia sp.]|nr:hypothetical protein [Puia sp.]